MSLGLASIGDGRILSVFELCVNKTMFKGALFTTDPLTVCKQDVHMKVKILERSMSL